MITTFTRDEILQQLDACTRDFTFPMLDNGYIYLADVRLSLFRDQARWVIVIEVVGYNHRAGGHDGIENCLHCYGNCLLRPPGTANEDFLSVTEDGVDGPTFDDDYDSIVLDAAKTIRLRDKVVPIDFTYDMLAELGIELAEPPEITGADLLRWLVLTHRELLLATEQELRERVPQDLPLVLRLDQWCHPDIVNDELPSNHETFRMLADILVTGDTSYYQPTNAPNTDWRNWPDSGSL
jgi:hypothetical protein